MKTLDQELLEIENFYKTATPSEAIAYFKAKSAECFVTLKEVCASAVRLVKKCIRITRSLFIRNRMTTVQSLRKQRVIVENTFRPYRKPLAELQEEVAMEELLIQAQEILIKSNSK